MTTSFELTIVHCINRYFVDNNIKGLAHRLKQSKFSSQIVDIIADSADLDKNLAIECKSVGIKRLSFTSNFHNTKDGMHQVDNITNYLQKTGRVGILAVEFRNVGVKNEAYFMPWKEVYKYYKTVASIPITEFQKFAKLDRIKDGYTISKEALQLCLDA